MSNYQNYLKTIVAVLGSIITGLTPFYGTAHWFPAVTAVATALTVYLVPNTSSKANVTPKP